MLWLISLLLATAPQEGVVSRLFAATSQGPFISYSWGEHWQRLRGDLRGFTGEIRAYACLGPTVFAGGTDGIFVSDDFGENYRRVERYSGPEVTVFLTARLFALEPTIFAGTTNGLHRSKDGGSKWIPVGAGVLSSTVRDLAWPGPDLFVAAEDGLYHSTDGGDRWERLESGLPDAPLLSLTVSRFFAADPVIFAGSRGAGLYRSGDGGERFEPVGETLFAGATVRDLFWWGSTLLVGTERGLFASDDGGASFESITELEGRAVFSISVPGAEEDVPSDLLVGTSEGVFKSSDGGRSFRHVIEGMGAEVDVLELSTFPLPPQYRERRPPR